MLFNIEEIQKNLYHLPKMVTVVTQSFELPAKGVLVRKNDCEEYCT